MTVEEFDAWCQAEDRVAAVGQAADETGGPRLSLVPVPEQEIAWPTDLLPPSDAPAEGEPPAAQPFDGIPLEDSRKRLAGWSAERQRVFLSCLAETGSVHLASGAARLSARSAYRLRVRSPAFAAAWDVAERLAVGRLSALAFDRAINGRTEQVWHDGALVAEKRMPSDRLLMWLLARLDPMRYAAPWEQRRDDTADPQAEARGAFAGQLDALTDTAADG
jgi:hypothetical protein